VRAGGPALEQAEHEAAAQQPQLVLRLVARPVQPRVRAQPDHREVGILHEGHLVRVTVRVTVRVRVRVRVAVRVRVRVSVRVSVRLRVRP